MATNVADGGEGDFGFQIAPMVDVVFVLLLFFMACAGQTIVEKELGIQLPSGSTVSAGPPPTPIIIKIDTTRQVYLNDSAIDTKLSRELPNLREWLKETIEQYGDKDPVIIRPDPEVRHDRIIDVLNAAAAAGVKNLSFS